jgi:hypothetical protein
MRFSVATGNRTPFCGQLFAAAQPHPGLENAYGQFAHIHLSNKGVVD